MQGWVRVEGGVEQTIQRLLGALLAQGVVDGLLVPLRTPDGRNAVPTLVRDPALLERAAPLAPVLPVNGATVLGQVTSQHRLFQAGAATGVPGRVGAVLRNCELRAAVELCQGAPGGAGRRHIDRHRLPGHLPGARLRPHGRAGARPRHPPPGRRQPLPSPSSLPSLPSLPPFPSLRPACTMCERPIPGAGESYPPHITIGLLGVPNAERLWVTVRDDPLGASIAECARPAPPAPLSPCCSAC